MQKLVWINSKGTEINLTSGDYGITEWVGFSACDVEVQTQNVPFQDGSVFLDALLNNRELSVTLAINDGKDLEKRYRLRRELISALNPKLGEGYLIYTNDFISKRIKCLAQMPVFPTHNSDKAGTPKASLSWTACDPYWEDVEETTVYLKKGVVTEIENDGDINTPMKIEFISNNVLNPKIENIKTKEKIEIRDLIINKNIMINTNMGQKEVYTEKINYNNLSSIEGLEQICYSEELGLFIIVGEHGTILKSSDGETFNFVNAETTEDLKCVYYSTLFHKFYAGGTNGLLLASVNGNDWEVIDLGISVRLSYITEENDLLIISGYLTVLSTSNGEDWSNGVINNDAGKVFYNPLTELYYSCGHGYVYSSSDCIQWTNISHFGNGFFFSKKLNLFFAVDSSTQKFYKSVDAINWQETNSNITIPTNIIMQEIDNNTEYSFIGYSYSRLYLSNDMQYFIIINMAQHAYDDYNYLRNIVFSENLAKFVIIGRNEIFNSYNLLDYSTITLGYLSELNDIICENGLFIAVGYGGAGNRDAIIFSTDSKKWYSASIYRTFYDIIYVKELSIFLAVGYNPGSNGYLFDSTNGKNWEGRSALLLTPKSITYSDELSLFVVVGENNISLSNDTLYWNTNQISYILNSVIYSDIFHVFIAVGNNGKIVTSADGITWEEKTSGVSYNLNSICYSKDLELFVAVGDNGTILTSQSLTTWDKKTSETTNSLKSCFYYNTFCIVGENGILMTSSDGDSWYHQDVNSNKTLTSITYSKEQDKYVLVGQNNLIIYSEKENIENIIDKLSVDSNMNFQLEKGKNLLLSKSDSGEFNTRISYRQKYIGV